MCLAENLRQGLFTNYLDKLEKGGGINFNFTLISFIKFYLKVKLSASHSTWPRNSKENLQNSL